MRFVLFCATGGGSTEWNVQTESRPTLCEIPEKCNFGITIGGCDLYWCWKYKRCVCLLAMDGFSIFSLSICCSLLHRLSLCFSWKLCLTFSIRCNQLQPVAPSVCLQKLLPGRISSLRRGPWAALTFFVLNIFNLFQSVAICCTVCLFAKTAPMGGSAAWEEGPGRPWLFCA